MKTLQELRSELKEAVSPQLSDAQQLQLMKDPNRVATIAALRRYKQVGDINKLSAGHRTLLTKYFEKTGGLRNVSRPTAINTLKNIQKMSAPKNPK